MATTPVYTVNNPTPGQTYYAPATSGCIPNAGSSVTAYCNAYDSNGNLLSVSSLTSIVRDSTANSTKNSYTYYGGNGCQCSTSSGTNGSDVFVAGGAVGQSGVAAIKFYLSYTGQSYGGPPSTPTMLSAYGQGNVGASSGFYLIAAYNDNYGIAMGQHHIQITNAYQGGGSFLWDQVTNASPNEISENQVARQWGVDITLAPLTAGGQYSWRIQTADQYGNWSPWTAWGDFTYGAAPNVPSNLSPSNVQTTLTPTWSFQYSSPGGTAMQAYRVWVTAQSGGGTVYDSGWVANGSASGSTLTGTITGGLSYASQYTVNVQVEDANGLYSGTATSTFSVASLPQATPSSPVNNVTVNSQTPTFGWSFNDTNYTQAKYQVQVYNKGTGALLWDSGAVSSAATSVVYGGAAIAWNTVIQWRVQVWDSANLASGWSGYATALVNNSPSALLTSPINNGVVTSNTPTVAWTYEASAAGYAQASATINLFDTSGNALGTWTQSGNATAFVFPSGVLLNGDTYQVSVSVVDSNNGSGTSGTHTFVVSYNAPADMAGQPLAAAKNYILSPYLNADSGNGIAQNFGSTLYNGVVASFSIDPNFIQPVALGNGDGLVTGAQRVALEAGSPATSSAMVYQDIAVATAGWIPGVTRLAAEAWVQVAVTGGAPTAQVALAYYDTNGAWLSQVYGGNQGDTAGSLVRLVGPQSALIPSNAATVRVLLIVNCTSTSDTATVWWCEAQAEGQASPLATPFLNVDGGGGVASGWNGYVNTSMTGSLAIDSNAGSPYKAAAQRIAITSSSTAGKDTAVNQGLACAAMGWTAGVTQLSIQAAVKLTKSAGAPTVQVGLYFKDSNGTIIGGAFYYGAAQGDTGGAWVTLAGPTMTIPVGTATVYANLHFLANSVGDTGTAWFTDCWIGTAAPATQTSDSSFVAGDRGPGYSFDTSGYSVRSYLAGGQPAVVANVGTSSDPVSGAGGTLTLTWDTSLADATRFTAYIVERRRQDQIPNDGAWVTLATITNKQQGSYTDYSAGASTTYQYSVRQQVTYADGTTGLSRARAVVAGSVNFSPAWYVVNIPSLTGGVVPIYNLRLNHVDPKRNLEWQENAEYSSFMGRMGTARDAGPDRGYKLDLVAYFNPTFGDDLPTVRRTLVNMQRMNTLWYVKGPQGLVIPCYLGGLKLPHEDTWGDTLLTVTLAFTQAQDTTDY